MEAASGSIETLRDAAPARWRDLRSYIVALRWPVLVYLGSRTLVLLVAAAEGQIQHHSLLHELANWDGKWYSSLAARGYPTFASHLHTTLGFFPLYPIVVGAVARGFARLELPLPFTQSVYLAGILVSGIGGLVATVLVQRLASGWWGEASGRRAAAFFCVFPGSVVFSMVYAEGLMIPLAAGCILALQRRRWLLAGSLAGLATATEPQALVLVIVCAVAAAREFRRRGWPQARASLQAPLLSLSGVLAFSAFLWAWTGTPLATLIAQRHAWHERTDPLALVHLVETLITRIVHYNPANSVYNPAGGVAGALLLLLLLVLLFRRRTTVSAEAIVWTLGITCLAVSSERLPPNARMLITAFPAVLVVGSYLAGRRFWLVQSANVILLAVMSWLTFVSHLLPP